MRHILVWLYDMMKAEKKERLRSLAQKKTEGGDTAAKKKPLVIKYGINHVTNLIEQKKATLVAIAHDVDPIEVIETGYERSEHIIFVHSKIYHWFFLSNLKLLASFSVCK